jgi:predicted Zn-ribbon and HTH transcriptional regulator
MTKKREQFKAELVAQVEALVVEALARGEEPLTLEEIEDIALSAQDEIAQFLTRGLIEHQAETGMVEPPLCPDCGQPMRAKGRKARYLRTRSGEIRVERAYYHCAKCGHGHFPPG